MPRNWRIRRENWGASNPLSTSTCQRPEPKWRHGEGGRELRMGCELAFCQTLPRLLARLSGRIAGRRRVPEFGHVCGGSITNVTIQARVVTIGAVIRRSV